MTEVIPFLVFSFATTIYTWFLRCFLFCMVTLYIILMRKSTRFSKKTLEFLGICWNSLESVGNHLAFFPLILVFITYHRAPVMHTEEYAPQTIPTIRGRANSRTLVTPMTYNTATIIKVVKEV